MIREATRLAYLQAEDAVARVGYRHLLSAVAAGGFVVGWIVGLTPAGRL